MRINGKLARPVTTVQEPRGFGGVPFADVDRWVARSEDQLRRLILAYGAEEGRRGRVIEIGHQFSVTSPIYIPVEAKNLTIRGNRQELTLAPLVERLFDWRGGGGLCDGVNLGSDTVHEGAFARVGGTNIMFRDCDSRSTVFLESDGDARTRVRDCQWLSADGAEWRVYSSISGFQDVEHGGSTEAVAADTWTDLDNDGTGSNSHSEYLPYGTTDLWDATTSSFDLTSLDVGDVVDIRFDFEVIPNFNNAAAEFRVLVTMADGAGSFVLDTILPSESKGSGVVHKQTVQMPIFVGSDVVRRGTLVPQIFIDKASAVDVHGWFIQVRKLGG